jgi:hypothetical protein
MNIRLTGFALLKGSLEPQVTKDIKMDQNQILVVKASVHYSFNKALFSTYYQ